MENYLEDSDGRRVILIIGGGWYGSVMAHQLKLMYSEARVIILEKNSELFTGTSGRFGFRAHRGEHYPRSFLTRFFIYIAMRLFSEHYSELMNKDRSIYALANTEKISKEEFKAVSNENRNTLGFEPEDGKVHIGGRQYCNISYAVENDEPSLAMGERLREWFKSKLHDVGVEVYCNFEVKTIEKQQEGKFLVTSTQGESFFPNHVINATGYQAVLTENLESVQERVSQDNTNSENIGSSQTKAPINEHPKNGLFFNAEISYQVCLAFVYKYRSSSAKLPPPQSVMFMDGNLPSLTRYDTRIDENEPFSMYVLTHVIHSMVGSYASPEEAKERLSTVDSDFTNERRGKAEAEMEKVYPGFREEFDYVTCESTVFVRTVTPEAFRGAFVIQDPNGVIVIFPGKISQTPLLVKEVNLLMKNDPNKIRVINGVSYVKGGTLDLAIAYGVFTLPVSAEEESSNKFLAALKESPHECFDPIKENPDKFLAALEESPRRFFALLKDSHHTLEENKSKTSQRVSGVSSTLEQLGDTCKNPTNFFKKFIPSSSSANRQTAINPNLDNLDTSRLALS